MNRMAFFGTNGRGVLRFDAGVERLEPLPFGLLSSGVGALEPEDGGVWVGTTPDVHGGYRSRTGFTWIAEDFQQTRHERGPGVNGFGFGHARDLMTWEGQRWAATDIGLVRFGGGAVQLMSTNNLANLYWNQGRYDEAEPLYLETLEIRKRVLGDDHPDTLGSMNGLGSLYHRQGRYEEAEPLYLETLEARKRVLGDDHPATTRTLYNLACFEAVFGEESKAIDWLRQSLEGATYRRPRRRRSLSFSRPIRNRIHPRHNHSTG